MNEVRGGEFMTPEEFFAALKADPRDIMPSHEQREVTVWRVVRTREEWGRSTPGWANPEGPESYIRVMP